MAGHGQLSEATAGTAGRFVTFEGGEGAGKSTQVRRLSGRLAAAGIETLVTREPGGSPRAERIRHLILSGAASAFGGIAEATLFAAARADHLDLTVRPALRRGALVLCDRFTDSTRVYQGVLAGIGAGILAGLETAAVGETRPDLTLVLDLPAELGLARARARGAAAGLAADRFEREGLAYHEAVRAAFLAIARAEPHRCIVIDAAAGPDAVEAEIWSALSARLGIRSSCDPVIR